MWDILDKASLGFAAIVVCGLVLFFGTLGVCWVIDKPKDALESVLGLSIVVGGFLLIMYGFSWVGDLVLWLYPSIDPHNPFGSHHT